MNKRNLAETRKLLLAKLQAESKGQRNYRFKTEGKTICVRASSEAHALKRVFASWPQAAQLLPIKRG